MSFVLFCFFKDEEEEEEEEEVEEEDTANTNSWFPLRSDMGASG